MNFLDICVVVNNKSIYFLYKEEPVIIPVAENHPKIVASDGFHVTEPMVLTYQQTPVRHLEVVCGIDNHQLAVWIMLLIIFSLVGVVSEVLLLKILSFIPILYFLFCFYINRKAFIRIKAVA